MPPETRTVGEKGWTALARINSMKGQLVLDHDAGRLTVEIYYLQSKPVIVAHVDCMSAAQRSARDYLFRFEDLPILLEHAASILRSSKQDSSPSREKAAERSCRLRTPEAGR